MSTNNRVRRAAKRRRRQRNRNQRPGSQRPAADPRAQARQGQPWSIERPPDEWLAQQPWPECLPRDALDALDALDERDDWDDWDDWHESHQEELEELDELDELDGQESWSIPPVDEMVEAMLISTAVQTNAVGGPADVGGVWEVDQRCAGLLDPVVESLLDKLVGEAWDRGWQPADLVEYAGRKATPAARPLLVIAIGAQHRRYTSATISPRWRGQLEEIGLADPGAGTHRRSLSWRRVDPSGERRSVRDWLAALDRERMAGLRIVVEVIGLLMFLSRLPRMEPLPGTYRPATGRGPRGEVDDRVLGRIRGLLAKAEATDFPDEAEALSTKAQELMAKHSLDRALVDGASGDDTAHGPEARRVWLDPPYVSAKANLVSQVAGANRCRAVIYDKPGFVAIVGAEVDLRLTELLATSLLVQANRAMLAAGPQSRGSTRSYRHSFLVAYACRIGERLQVATRAAEEAAAQTAPDRLLPVLAARGRQVDERFAELFPHTRTRQTSVSNGAGWEAGRTAADLANLNVSRPISGAGSD